MVRYCFPQFANYLFLSCLLVLALSSRQDILNKPERRGEIQEIHPLLTKGELYPTKKNLGDDNHPWTYPALATM